MMRLSPDLSAAIRNQPQSSVSSISIIMYGTANTGTGRGYFARNTARMESEVLAKQVVAPKEKRGIPGSRESGVHYLAATGAFDPTLGTARFFLPTSREGEPDNQYNNTQEMYLGSAQEVRQVKHGGSIKGSEHY